MRRVGEERLAESACCRLRRSYQSRGFLFYVDGAGKWHKLGKEWDKAAKTRWAELSTGKAPAGTVAELLDRYMLNLEERLRASTYSPASFEVNQYEVIKLKAVFGRMQWADVTSQHAAQYLRKRKTKAGKPAPVRANREISLLSSAYSWGMGEDGLDVRSNPCFGVRHNSETPRDRYVQTSELRALRAHMPAWMRVYILLKRLTGMRQADILTLRRDAITGRGIEYTESKGRRRAGAHRLIRWSWALRATVGAALKLHGEVAKLPLFPAEHGGHFSRYGFRTAWARAMRKYVTAGGERFTEHDIRAKAGSDVGDDAHAQELLGHESVSTTRRVYRRGQVKVDPAR